PRRARRQGGPPLARLPTGGNAPVDRSPWGHGTPHAPHEGYDGLHDPDSQTHPRPPRDDAPRQVRPRPDARQPWRAGCAREAIRQWSRRRGHGRREDAMTKQRLSPTDAAFLYYERPGQRFHGGSVSLLDGPVPFDAFTDLTVERLRGLSRYLQRPVRPVLDWTLPSWQDVPRFAPPPHIPHRRVPPPGGDAALDRVVRE